MPGLGILASLVGGPGARRGLGIPGGMPVSLRNYPFCSFHSKGFYPLHRGAHLTVCERAEQGLCDARHRLATLFYLVYICVYHEAGLVKEGDGVVEQVSEV